MIFYIELIFFYLISLSIALFYCVFRVTAVDGHYQIGIYSLREIQHGEEITFDYNSVTEVCPVATDFCLFYTMR